MFKETNGKKGHMFLVPALAAVLAAAGVLVFVFQKYTVTTVYVKGNLHYTQEEIQNIVMEGPLGHNSIYLSLKYRNQGAGKIPFVSAMDVNILAPDTIEIMVYEKALAGYVRYMDTNMYFDKDGYVVECSDVLTAGVPQITGLNFDYVVLGEPLPVEDKNIFNSIMELTKLLDKYELTADKIFFQSEGDITIYFGTVKAALGNDRAELENKVMRLPQLLAKVEGKTGTLRMENLTEDKTGVTFQNE